MVSILWIVFSPQRHLRELPEPVEDEPAATDPGEARWGAFGEPQPTDGD
jgi:hypothetical protein